MEGAMHEDGDIGEQRVDYRQLLRSNNRIISRSLVVSHALLNDLTVNEYLEDAVVYKVEQLTTPQEKVDELLIVLRNVPQQQAESVFEVFLSALRQDGQEHVANVFHPETGARPMSNEHYSLLVSNQRNVCECLDPLNGLLDELVSQVVFSDRERNSVMNKTEYDDRSRELMNILQRKADSAFETFIGALCATRQEHVASLLGHECSERPMTQEHRRHLNSKLEELSQFMNPTDSLLNRLVAVDVFSTRDADSVTSRSIYAEMCTKLVYCLLRKPDSSFDKFIEALNTTDQQHVVHILTGQGESPLSRVRRLVLIRLHDTLVKRIDTLHTSLLSTLFSRGVVTDTEKQRIEALSVNEVRSARLIDIVARKSQRTYDNFLEALKDSGHQLIAETLKGLELKGEIDSHFLSSTLPTERNRIVRVVEGNMEVLVGGRGHSFDEFTRLMEQSFFVVTEISVGSIHISFRCFTEESLVSLKQLLTDKTFDKLLTEMFCPEFAVEGLESLTLHIADGEFEKCTETFKQMEDYYRLRDMPRTVKVEEPCSIIATSNVTLLPICPLCQSAIFDNPQSLPCRHTFCITCFEGHCKNKLMSEDELICPVCKEELNLSSTGLDVFSNDFSLTRSAEERIALAPAAVDKPFEFCTKAEENDEVAGSCLGTSCHQFMSDLKVENEQFSSETSNVALLSTCPLCQDMIANPKSLPCLHTFCLRCLENHCKDKQPGDEALCPKCGEMFNLPSTGLGGLKRNLFVERLVEERIALASAAAATTDKRVQCESCVETEETDGPVTATVYCVDCGEHLCEKCSRPHKRMKTGPHNVLAIDSEEMMEMTRTRESKCHKHVKYEVIRYCFDCNENICLLCSADEHDKHKRQEINEAAADFKEQIGEHSSIIFAIENAIRLLLSKVEGEKLKFVARIGEEYTKVLTAGTKIKSVVDCRVRQLLTELNAVKEENLDQLEIHTKKLQSILLRMDGFSSYWNELKTNGKPSDVTRAANDLQGRSIKVAGLLKSEFSSLTDYSRRAPTIVFVPADDEETQNEFVGKLCIDKFSGVHITEKLKTDEGESFDCMTVLDDEIYLLCTSATGDKKARVYDKMCSLKRRILIHKLAFCVDMAACKRNRCLYITVDGGRVESVEKCKGFYYVHRLSTADGDDVTSWRLDEKPCGLSVTPQFTVLVTCNEVAKLLEFTTHGELLREISLHPDIVNPIHAIQLSSNGHFVVCYGERKNEFHGVSIVDSHSNVKFSYRTEPGSATVEQLNCPSCLVVDKNDFIFVADTDNKRVILLSPVLDFVRVVYRLETLRPYSMHLEADKRRLTVATANKLLILSILE